MNISPAVSPNLTHSLYNQPTINSLHHFFRDCKFGDGIKFCSGEGEQVCRPGSGEEETEYCDNKLTLLLATLG
jgi:hypothetical protein